MKGILAKTYHASIALMTWLSAKQNCTYSGVTVLEWSIITIAALTRVALVAQLKPTIYPDSEVYTAMAKLPLLSSGLLAGPRPFIVPLFYKACSLNGLAIILAQAACAAIAWGALALTVAKGLNLPRIRVMAIVVILVFSFSPCVVQWDASILSESLFLSLMALHIVAWFWFRRQRGWPQTVAVVVTGVLWAFSRDTAVYVLAVLVPIVAGYALLRRRAQHAVIAIMFILTFVGSWTSSSRGERWLYPFLNTLGKRILPNATARRFFVEHGMPISSALLRMSGKKAYEEDWAYYRDPNLEPFRRWARGRGRTVYIQFLESQPLYFFTAPLYSAGALEDLLSADLSSYQPQRLTPSLLRYVEKIVYPSISGRPMILPHATTDARFKLVVWIMLCGIFSIVALRTHRREVIVPIAMIALSYPIMLIVWHGDATEIPRHALKIGVGLRLATWILLLLALDSTLRRIPERSTNSVKPNTDRHRPKSQALGSDQTLGQGRDPSRRTGRRAARSLRRSSRRQTVLYIL
jgi:hypothetical protein